MSDRPQRAQEIEINEVADGFVIYDPGRDRVHYLNHTAAIVLEFCTGENDTAEIARLLQRAFELAEPPEVEIEECVSQLRDEGLIV